MRNSESKTRQTVVKLTQQLADADTRIQELTKQRDLLKHAAKGQKKRAIKAEEEIARLRGCNGGNAEKVGLINYFINNFFIAVLIKS